MMRFGADAPDSSRLGPSFRIEDYRKEEVLINSNVNGDDCAVYPSCVYVLIRALSTGAVLKPVLAISLQ